MATRVFLLPKESGKTLINNKNIARCVFSTQSTNDEICILEGTNQALDDYTRDNQGLQDVAQLELDRDEMANIVLVLLQLKDKTEKLEKCIEALEKQLKSREE